MGKIEEFVLLKMFNNGKGKCNTINAPLSIRETLFSNQKYIQSMISEDQKNVTTQLL